MSTIVKDLGIATAYGYAVSKGYTGTEEEFAQLMANYATVGQTATEAAGQAVSSAEASGVDSLKSEGYSVGKQNGEDVEEGSPYYHNNAKYYAEEAKDSETNAGNSESAASDSATDAETNALKSEGFAVGKQDGTAVTSGSPYYQNNSKYYSEQSAASAATSAAMTGLAPAFSASKAYAAGDYVLYNGTLYRFAAAHAAGAWTGTDATAVTLAPDVTDLNSALSYLPWFESYDKNEVSNGFLKSDGTIQTENAQGWHITDFIPITPTTNAIYKGLTTIGVAPMSGYFDSNKVFISPSFKQATGTNSLSSIPSDAAYVRFSIYDADLDTFSFSVQKLPSFADLSDLHDSIFDAIPVEITLDSASDAWSKKAGYIATQNGWSESASYDSYYFTAERDGYIYCSNAPVGEYVQLAVCPSGDFGDPNYKRYRNSDSNLPTSANKLLVSHGTLVTVSVTKNSTTFEFKYDSTKDEVKGINDTKYHLSYDDGVLSISGRGLNCDFSDETFEHTNGLFELQTLTINDCLIFGSENDYIGPVKIRNESIVGAKHGGETTDSIKIFADGKEVIDGASMYADSISIYVTSHIDTRFSRVSTYTISFGKLSASSLIVQNEDLNIENIFGAGIISSYDDTTLAWINNYLLTSGDTTGNLGEQTIIVTNKGNVTSRRTQNKSAYTNSPVYFITYTGRKKLYYYNTYRLQNTTLPSGSVYSSSADLLW